MPDERVETLGAIFKRARWGVEEIYPDIDDECAASAFEALDIVEQHLKDGGLLTAPIIPGPDGGVSVVMPEALEAAQHWYEKNEMVADGRPFPGCAEAAQRRHFASRRAVFGILTALLPGVERAGEVVTVPEPGGTLDGMWDGPGFQFSTGDRIYIKRRESEAP